MAKQKYKFERLTPIDNMDLDVYEEAIDYVFSNSDVKNVAISGAYSAGKSSVLASYKKKHDELRFLHISLAHFKSTDQESDAEVKESTLEGKILNQLIHQIPSEKIPQTNFRVKKTVSSKSIATSTIGAVLFLISILHLLFFSVWKNYIGVLPVSLIKSILMPSTHPYALIVDGIIILVLLSLSVYKLIRIQREKNIFRKLNIKGNEIEIFEKSDDSYFDKYLNEVLYLFENSDADVIVFEDMDRFNTNGIFEKKDAASRKKDIQPIFSVNIVAIDVQLDGTAEAFSLSGKGKNPVHKNVKISVENVNRFPIKHVIVFNKYITPLLKYNEVQFVHCAYYGSDDAKKWPNKLAVLTDDEFEHNEQGIPKWFNINYEDVDGNEMYQTFELKDFDGTPYYSLESINDI